MWETGMYLTRTQLTRWSIPVAIHGNCFNGQYFWDALAGAKALVQAGHWPLVQRMADHQLSVIPLGMQMTDSIGARLEQATYEGGYFQIQPMGCSIYEVHANGTPPRLVWIWLQYAGLDKSLLAAYDGDEGVSFTPLAWAESLFTNGWIPPEDPRLRRTLETWLKECKTAENWATACSSDLAMDIASMDVNAANPITWTWLPAWAIEVAALIRDGDLALQTAAEMIRCAGNFGSLYECKCLTDGFVSLPIFVTSHAEFSSAIPMMLIQDDGRRIDLLPAVPSAWKTFSFQLAVTNRTTARVEVRDGALAALALQGPVSPRAVRIPRRSRPAGLLGPAAAEEGEWQVFQVQVKADPPERQQFAL